MTANTLTNGAVPADIIKRLFSKQPAPTVAPTPAATPTVEVQQKRGAATRIDRDNRVAAVEQALNVQTQQIGQLLDMVKKLAAAPQAPQAPQAPKVTPKRVVRFAIKRGAPTQPRKPVTGEFAPSNLAAVNAALKAKGCGCEAAYTRRIWADSGVIVMDNERGIAYVGNPPQYARGINGRIMQVFCECQVLAS
jgi:hypothetical protein